MDSLRAFFVISVWSGIVVLATVAIIYSNNIDVEAIAREAAQETIEANGNSGLRRDEQGDTTVPPSGNTFKDQVETWQALITTTGIVAAGSWALFIFVLGRSSAGIVWIGIEPRYRVVLSSGRGLVVSVRIKNTGRTRVEKVEARIQAIPITETRLGAWSSEPNVMAAAVPSPATLGTDLFSRELSTEERRFAVTMEAGLEPGAETSEEILIFLGDARTARVEASYIAKVPFASMRATGKVFLVWLGKFFGIEPASDYVDPRIRNFNSRIILDIEAVPTTLAPGDTGA